MTSKTAQEAVNLIEQLLDLWAAPGPWAPGESTREGLTRVARPLVEAFAAARVAKERERCAGIADAWFATYPEDIFIPPPPGQHGETVDACSARAARHVARGIAAAIRDGEETP